MPVFAHGWAEQFEFQRGSGSANFQDEAAAAALKTAAEAATASDLQHLGGGGVGCGGVGWGVGEWGAGWFGALKGIHKEKHNLGFARFPFGGFN